MRKVFMVIRREYLQSITKKSFWIGTIAFPALMLLLIGLSAGAQLLNPKTQKKIAFLDATGSLAEAVSRHLAENKLDDGRPEYIIEPVPISGDLQEAVRRLQPRVLDGDLYGILTADGGIEGEGGFSLYRKNVGDDTTSRVLRGAVQDAVVGLRLRRSDLSLDRETLDAIMEPIHLDNFEATVTGEARKMDPRLAQAAMFIFSLMLYFTLYFYGFATARGIIQEKSNRVMEVLLGSLTHNQLMSGKILGIGLVGLTQVGIYVLTAFAVRLYFLVRMNPRDLQAALDFIAPANLIFFVAFFLLGYFLYTSLFAMVGAVCNTEQDAQNLQLPLVGLLLIPYMMTIFFVKHPDSMVSVVSSLFPPFTPMVMFMRISIQPPPAWQVVLSIALMLATIFILFRAAAKVFRIGTLMHGKRPTIPEILRWARG
ncbi:MAG: ABC transporter permease [Acidobacteriota bacterium]